MKCEHYGYDGDAVLVELDDDKLLRLFCPKCSGYSSIFAPTPTPKKVTPLSEKKGF